MCQSKVAIVCERDASDFARGRECSCAGCPCGEVAIGVDEHYIAVVKAVKFQIDCADGAGVLRLPLAGDAVFEVYADLIADSACRSAVVGDGDKLQLSQCVGVRRVCAREVAVG